MNTIKLQPLGENIRVKYSMMINFSGRLLALLVNILFVFIVTRKLDILEFSWWIILNKYAIYAVIFTSIYTFWTNRAISRGWNVSKTSLFMSVLLGIIVSGLSTIVMFIFYLIFEIPLTVALSFIIVIFEEYIIRALLSISASYKPQHIGLYQASLAIMKTGFAYMFIIIYRLGILGALFSLFCAKFILILLFLILNRGLISNSNLDRILMSRWLRYSWYSIALSSISSLHSFDVIVVGYISGNALVIAYYGVIFFLLSFISSSAQARSAIYSKALVRGDLKIIDEGLWLTMLFVVPAISIISSLSRPVIAIFGVKYLMVSPLVPIFTVATGLRIIYFISEDAILAWEQSDWEIYRDIRIRNTALFDVLIIEAIQVFLYLFALGAISFFISDVELILLYWGIVAVLKAVLGLLLSFVVSKKRFGFTIIHRGNLAEILRITIVGIIVYLIGKLIYVEVSPRFYVMISRLLLPAGFLVLMYGVLLLIVDRKARKLVIYIIHKLISLVR